jgi:hypothetical protein
MSASRFLSRHWNTFTYFSNFIDYVLESSINERLLMIRSYIHSSSELGRRFIQVPLQLGIRACGWEAVVICRSPGIEIYDFNPPARSEMVIRLFEEARPVGDTATHGTEPDIVKGLGERERPFGLGIVDLEAEIWWDPVGSLSWNLD